jgi:hypothetical protein
MGEFAREPKGREGMKNGRVLFVIALVGVVALAFAVAEISHADRETPAPSVASPSRVGSGRICFSDRPIDTCNGVAGSPTFYSDQGISFYIQMPFYADAYVYLQVSRLDGSVSTVVREFDIQVIPNPAGVYNEIGPAAALNGAATDGPLRTYWVNAYLGDTHVAQGTSYLEDTHVAQGGVYIAAGTRPPAAT